MTLALSENVEPSAMLRDRSYRRSLSLLAIFVLLSVWGVVFRWTGEGDSGMHFMNLREATQRPYFGLYPWARPGFVAIFVYPAMLGLEFTKIVSAGITTLLCWQTMKLADDLKLPRATLAGWFVLAQPLAFYLAADTMTELPFALFLLLAIRAWTHGHFFASFMLVGFLPLLRPEGFFIGPVWGVLALLTPRLGPIWKRPLWTLTMLHGLVLWSLASVALSPGFHWNFWIHGWSWDADTKALYGRGNIFHHVYMWPYYTGPAVLVLWLLGVRRSLRRGMALPWIAWGVIIGVHSVLWWGGWFGALGLMRIQCASAFTTAIVTLFGWSALQDQLATRTSRYRVSCNAAIATLLIATPLAYYGLNPESWHFVSTRRAAAFIRANGLLRDAPRTFFSDVIATMDADGWRVEAPRIDCSFDWLTMRRKMLALPIGSVGTWDNQRGQVWHGVSIEWLQRNGFEVIFDARFRPPGQKLMHALIPALRRRPLEQRVAVLRRVSMPSN